MHVNGNNLAIFGKFTNFVSEDFTTMPTRKITIIDVAEKAGVSKGTVDRVLHNRGEVSRKSAEKVRKAIEELSYEPNLYASLLASRKRFTIACLLPESLPGEYWHCIYDGAVKGGEDVSSLNISVVFFLYDQYERQSFLDACGRLLDSSPDGVVIPPLFKNDTMALAEELALREIPYVYVDTKLEDNDYLAYFGMPMYRSGYLCARLLTERCREDQVSDIAVVRLVRDKARQSDPTFTRRSGFMDYLGTYFPGCRVHTLFIDPSAPESNGRDLEEFFAGEGPFKYVVMFSSRIHLISEFLSKHPDRERRVIGFDSLEGNLEALRKGSVSILITQHTDLLSRRAINVLADNILMHKSPSAKDNYMHMDILTRYNLEDY